MSAPRRAPKPRYVLTPDRDRIAMVAGGSCGFLVLIVSAFVQQHPILEAIFRAMVALLVTYAAARIVVWVVAYLRDTQSVVEDVTPEPQVEEPNTE
jgi:hypothetical protein